MRPDDFMALVERHAATITLSLLLDLAKALNLRLGVELIDDEKELGT